MTFFWFGDCLLLEYDGICQIQGSNKVFVKCLMNCLPPLISPSVHCWREARRFLKTVLM